MSATKPKTYHWPFSLFRMYATSVTGFFLKLLHGAILNAILIGVL